MIRSPCWVRTTPNRGASCASSCRARRRLRCWRATAAMPLGRLAPVAPPGLFVGRGRQRGALSAAHHLARTRCRKPRIPTPSARCSAISTCICSTKAGISNSHRIWAPTWRRSTACDGVRFAVWAPNARAVSVVGDFNTWDPRRNPMRLRYPAGVWELFIPASGAGARYKFAIVGPDGWRLPLKADPLARATEPPPATASVVVGSHAACLARRSMDAARARATCDRRADLDLRSARRIVVPSRRAHPDLGRAGRTAGALCQRDGFHAMSS